LNQVTAGNGFKIDHGPAPPRLRRIADQPDYG
jgi:hypothetical protein